MPRRRFGNRILTIKSFQVPPDKPPQKAYKPSMKRNTSLSRGFEYLNHRQRL